VFQLDPDFKERMFARQMAVMKGQAWNVVETLKTPDHGPLELTRRARVCVWDDFVDVPVAVAMRATSSELHRSHDPASGNSHTYPGTIDEMDIGASIASSAPTAGLHGPNLDLLGFASPPPADMPHPGRFELTSPTPPPPPSADLASADEMSISNASSSRRPAAPRKSDSEPEQQANGGAPLGHGRASYQGPPRSLHPYSPARQGQQQQQRRGHFRRYSHASGPSRKTASIAQQLYGDGLDEDDIDGDLGYAAAEGMDGIHRKVIVERLEMVKAKNPVFSCW
jgi:hypothetical protein